MKKNYRLESAIDYNHGSASFDEISYSTTLGSEGKTLVTTYSKETFIPLSIIKNNSSLEAIVVYLKDALQLKFSEISSLLNRNPRTIWATYSKAKKKDVKKSVASAGDEILIPSSILSSRRLSILESIVLFLKEDQDLSFNQISALLGKNYRTIWTVYRRGLLKVEKING